MESFFRYIAYVDYYKRGERIRNVGFLRWKLYQGEHQIEIQLKDVFHQQGTFDIREKNTDKKIGDMVLDKGIGSFLKKFPNRTASEEIYIDTMDDRLYMGDVEGFVIWLNSNDYLSVPIKLNVNKKDRDYELGKEKVVNTLENNVSERIEDTLSNNKGNLRSKKGSNQETEAASENILIEGNKEKYEEPVYIKKGGYKEEIKKERRLERYDENAKIGRTPEEYNKDAKMEKVSERYKEDAKMERVSERYKEDAKMGKVSERYKEDAKMEKVLEGYNENTKVERILENKKSMDRVIKIIEPIHEDKWKQLCKEYPNVHPFPNHKIFLSIKPEDFIILQQKYQKLVHNSFLLHGFYNYGYMILGKLSEEEKAPIYIGVPGVYYEREKQAAQMFGFVGFESTEYPVQAGSYGYYMIEVEI